VSVETTSPFDIPWAQGFNEVRQNFTKKFLQGVRRQIVLETAVDVGCGVGYFSRFLSDLGFQVLGIDGRDQNVAEAASRHPGIKFLVADAEYLPLQQLNTFDLVLCVGLLYHLENPFRAIRNLHHLTAKVLLIESMCASGSRPNMELIDEGHGENQALNYVAFYPSEPCLIKMLYRAGFPYVYSFNALPAHPLFHASLWRRKARTMLVASREKLNDSELLLAPDVRESWEILSTGRERLKTRLDQFFGPVRRLWRLSAPNPQEGEKNDRG